MNAYQFFTNFPRKLIRSYKNLQVPHVCILSIYSVYYCVFILYIVISIQSRYYPHDEAAGIKNAGIAGVLGSEEPETYAKYANFTPITTTEMTLQEPIEKHLSHPIGAFSFSIRISSEYSLTSSPYPF